MPIIQGYTTQNDKWEVLHDKELVKHDLLMEIYTHKGECDWNPSLGSTIIDQVFQYKNSATKGIIVEELQQIVNNNQFLTLQDISVTDLDKGWNFNLYVSYLGQVPEEWVIPLTEETAKTYLSTGSLPLI